MGSPGSPVGTHGRASLRVPKTKPFPKPNHSQNQTIPKTKPFPKPNHSRNQTVPETNPSLKPIRP
jgi:hypothetical protein